MFGKTGLDILGSLGRRADAANKKRDLVRVTKTESTE